MSQTREIALTDILSDPNQPRKIFDETSLRELADSIQKQGLLQPILVKPIDGNKFQIVSGERRFRACKMLGIEKIEAEVKELDGNAILEIQLIENLQRQDLSPLEEAQTFQRMTEELGYSHEDIAKKISKSREYVANKVRLLKAKQMIKEALATGRITEGHARAIMPINENEQQEVLNSVIQQNLNVRQTEELVRQKQNVSRETQPVEIPEEGLIIGIWVTSKTLFSLKKKADSEKTTIEKVCTQVIAQEAAKIE